MTESSGWCRNWERDEGSGWCLFKDTVQRPIYLHRLNMIYIKISVRFYALPVFSHHILKIGSGGHFAREYINYLIIFMPFLVKHIDFFIVHWFFSIFLINFISFKIILQYGALFYEGQFRLEFYRVELFPDNPVPPLKRAVQMFSRALLVVAPHGAGLSNVFFSEPGTIIIEGLCYDGGMANMCYRSVCRSLYRRPSKG